MKENKNAPRHMLTCFPSGLTVGAARVEANERLLNSQALTMVEALNHIAMRELGLTWQDAITKLYQQQNVIVQQEKPNNKPKQLKQNSPVSKKPNAKNTDAKKTGTKTTTNNTNVEKNDLSQSNSSKSNSSKNDSALMADWVGEPKKKPNAVKVAFSYTLHDIQKLMKQYPQLGYDGYLDPNLSVSDKSNQRAMLSVAFNAFNVSYYLLSQCKQIKTYNKKLNSKLLAEKLSDYAHKKHLIAPAESIAVGAVIICAQELGFNVKQTSQGTLFNISSRSAVFAD